MPAHNPAQRLARLFLLPLSWLSDRLGRWFYVGLAVAIGAAAAFAIAGGSTSGMKNKADLDVIVERCLTRAALWDEVKDRLNTLGSLLSGGQQQRLTIARALSQEPELPFAQSRIWSIAAEAAEAALEAPRALMIAAPRCWTVGIKVSTYQSLSTFSFTGAPSTVA